VDQSIAQFVKDVGFPVVVCGWFMWRLERILNKTTQRLSLLTAAVNKMAKTLDVPDEDMNVEAPPPIEKE
jgi:hypothetical protein